MLFENLTSFDDQFSQLICECFLRSKFLTWWQRGSSDTFKIAEVARRAKGPAQQGIDRLPTDPTIWYKHPTQHLPTMTAHRSSSQPDITLPTESAFSRLIAGPVLFVSFLISLAFIDKNNSNRVFGHSAEKGEHYHSHQRKLGKQEINDAFQQKNKVILLFLFVGGVGLAIAGWTTVMFWEWVWGMR